jgi:hypothetical protein
MGKVHLIIPSILMFFILCGCDRTENVDYISAISITANGTEFTNGIENMPTDITISIVFSATVQKENFESLLSVTSGIQLVPLEIDFYNQNSKIDIHIMLDYASEYEFKIGSGVIGMTGQILEDDIVIHFSTGTDQKIYSMPPCTTATDGCLHSVEMSGTGTGIFNFYASYPIYEELAEWKELDAAIIVLHGVNRNANDYFQYMMNALKSTGIENNVVLISPFFKNQSEASGGDFYWNSVNWREGQNSISGSKISSFEVLDNLIKQLTDSKFFPAMKNIIVTGHSSGALMSHLYAGSNKVQDDYPNIDFDHIVANSQYFYYPDGQRMDENTENLFTPADCSSYNVWPFGFSAIPPYLSETSKGSFNDHFVNRSVIYLLGNGTGSDSSLNTSSCHATLLGSSRYQRGENMFKYMELVYPGMHQHSKTIVNGIGHDGNGMYNSTTFKSLLQEILNN